MINYTEIQLKESITKHRMSLFTIAMFWIYFRHCYFFCDFSFGIFDYITRIGDCGVDVFLFLSGYGLHYSIKKYPSKSEFYKKRILRIFPSVFLLLIFFAISDACLGKGTILKVFTPIYWINSLYITYWYVTAIFVFYFLFPLLDKWTKKRGRLYPCLISCLIGVAGIIIIHVVKLEIINQLVVYFARIPVFIFGLCIARFGFLKFKTTVILFIISIPLIYFLPKDFQRMSYVFFILPLMHWLPLLLEFLPAAISHILQYLGKLSLDFYIIHIYMFLNSVPLYFYRLCESLFISSIITLLIVLLLSSITCNIINQIIRRYENKSC